MGDIKKFLDVDDFIVQIKDIIADIYMSRRDQRLFFGKVILYFEHGRITHMEKHEVVK